ncbi:hypothetical protein [Roseomonas sp. CECT 9278]|uniref:hypothetical protein n=1 Tax=Roseomonas sp. CECT 9278 TaxID=2845823 RepID=UPI001E351270|nr:hypothetical protein [Roseomonas sp. CECT 9278]CAH0253196.1 hypothetical protein ROS9278_03200 [Roseomonas sp. CECT 9278]
MRHPIHGLRRTVPAAGALLGLLALAGCGSALSDSSALGGEARPAAYPGRITLNSQPAGARCILTNTADGSRIGEVTTPAQVPLARGTAIIEAACSAPGHLETTLALRPVRDFAEGIHHPQPVGTGAIQNAAVVRSGSTRRYNDTTVMLPPQSFPSAEARDAWFTDRASAIRAAAAPSIARAQRASNATIDTPQVLQGYLAADLAALDRQKAAAIVAAPAAEAAPEAPARRRR